MKKVRNPYSKETRYVLSSTREPIVDNKAFPAGARKNGKWSFSSSPVVASDGSVNASSKKDLMNQIARLVTSASSQEVKPENHINSMKAIAEENAQIIAAAKQDRNGPGFQALGQAIGDEVWETENRQGFARSVLLLKPMAKGEDGKIRIRRKDVMAYMATGPSTAIESQIKQDWMYPPEFMLQARVLIDLIQLRQDTGDLLEDKYTDALEQLMVQEDKMLKDLSDRAAIVRNDLIVFNALSPQVFTSMRSQIGHWNLTPAQAIIAFDLWDDIIADPTFSSWYSPVEKHQLILEGKIGSLLNVEIKTDGYRYETLQVLNPGEIYMYAQPQSVGALLQGQELMAENINQYNIGKGNVGWYMAQTEAMGIGNSLGVCRGTRS